MMRSSLLAPLLGASLFLTAWTLNPSCAWSQEQREGGASAKHLPADDWPTYRYDSQRSGVTPAKLKFPLQLRWVYRARRRPSPAWPLPAKQDFWHGKKDLRPRVAFDRAFHLVSDGKRVYFGSSADDQVRALSLADGRQVWNFFSDGPVRLAPTVSGGRVYFGSDGGRVYCLDAAKGSPVWRFQAAQRKRIIPGNGRLISIHPVRTDVLVQGDVVRFASGLFPAQGAQQFALRSSDGKQLAQGKISFSPQGYMQNVNGALRVAQGRSPQAQVARVPESEKRSGVKQPPSAKSPKPSQALPYSMIQAGGVNIGGGDGVVASLASDGKPSWSAQVEGQAHSLAVAAGCLLVSTDQGVIYCFQSTAAQPPTPFQRQPTVSHFPWKNTAEQTKFERMAEQANVSLNATAGYCLLLGGDARWAAALAAKTPLRIVFLHQDATRAAALRRELEAAGLYGSVVVKTHAPSEPLPFAAGIFNLVVCAPGSQAWTEGEIAKQVRPAGGLLIDARRADSQDRSKDRSQRQSQLTAWRAASDQQLAAIDEEAEKGVVTLRRAALQGVGEWTHMYGNAANTACSDDSLVRGELDLQWFGPPGPREMVDRHHRTTPPLCTDGRLFVPGNETIYGVDAYNGAVLWQTDVANFRRVGAPRDGGNLAATPDTLYAVAKDRCYALSAKDGAQLAAFAAPAINSSAREWGFVAAEGEALFGSTTQPGASRSDHNRQQIAGTYYDFVPIVVSDSVFRLQRHNGQSQWRYQATGAILNPTITLGPKRVYFVESRDPQTLDAKHRGRLKLAQFFAAGSDLVAVDRESGKVAWRKSTDFSKIQHHLYLAYAQGKLVSVGTRNEKSGSRNTVRYDLSVFAAANGELVWQATQDQGQSAGGSHGEQDHHPAIVGDLILQEPYAYNLQSGERRKDWRFARQGHGCGTVSASANAFFFRAGNPTMCEIDSGRKTKVNAVSRPGCWINIIPAGGLLLIPEASSGCTCNFPIQSSMAFAPRVKRSAPAAK